MGVCLELPCEEGEGQCHWDGHCIGYDVKCLPGQRIQRVRKFSASRHFFKTNAIQSVTEFILYSQKTRNCGNFLSNLAN